MTCRPFHILIGVVVAFGIAIAVPDRAHGQTVANGPYYALPSWSQKLQCNTQATCPRFVVLANWNNEAVLDRETGVVWHRAPSVTAFTWADASEICIRSEIGQRRGWRLPTIQELASLYDDQTSSTGPQIPGGHPFLNVQSRYWSATSFEADDAFAWTSEFHLGGSGVTRRFKTDFLPTWCVRGGMGL